MGTDLNVVVGLAYLLLFVYGLRVGEATRLQVRGLGDTGFFFRKFNGPQTHPPAWAPTHSVSGFVDLGSRI